MNRKTLAPVLVLLAMGCDGSTGPDDGGAQPFLRAIIDGVWASTPQTALAEAGALPGSFTIEGASTTSGNAASLTIRLFNVGQTGTYPLGVGSQMAGGTVLFTSSAGTWSSPLSGAAGSVTITKLQQDRLAGTFTVTLDPLTGGATGTKSVSGGEFDVPLQSFGPLQPVPSDAVSRYAATLGGTAWNAAAVSGTHFGNNLIAAGNNDTHAVTVSLAGVVTPGSFQVAPLTPTSSIVVTRSVNSQVVDSWSTAGTGGSGTIVVTELSETRLKGTFNGTLGPAPGSPTTSSLEVTSGSFDLRRN